MENWREQALRLSSTLEHAFDKARLRFKQKFGLLDDIIIQAYTGYGNAEKVFITGRVIEAQGLDAPEEDASLWDNIKILYHRYESDEVPNAPLSYKFHELEGGTNTDEEGYFHLEIPNPKKLTGWQTISFQLQKQYKADQGPVATEAKVLLQSPTSSFGIISDLDDTVVVSQATNFFEKSRILVMNNERTRKPFAGVASFYQALQSGRDGKRNNPVFYLSSSSWNLWDMFKNFCEYNGLPAGVFLLRDVGLDPHKFYRTSHKSHKTDKINHLLETFKGLSFILIGDSGQDDPEIFEQAVREHPERILAVYIRDVHPEQNRPRDEEVKAIAKKVEQTGTPMQLVKNSYEAAQHAAKMGFIPDLCLAAIERDTQKEELEEEDLANFLGLHRLKI